MAQQGGVSLPEWGGHWFPEYSIEFRTKKYALISKLALMLLRLSNKHQTEKINFDRKLNDI
jgi:hypothetical protein